MTNSIQEIKNYTLFLDRDGVINKKIPNNYVINWADFVFEKGALQALKTLSGIFKTIIIVTNQQGIGKNLMTEADLLDIHQKMQAEIALAHGRIDKIYHAPQLAAENSEFRKPNTGMAWQAKADFEHINFEKSIIVGDAATDMQWGRKLGMICVAIGNDNLGGDECFGSLEAFAHFFK